MGYPNGSLEQTTAFGVAFGVFFLKFILGRHWTENRSFGKTKFEI